MAVVRIHSDLQYDLEDVARNSTLVITLEICLVALHDVFRDILRLVEDDECPAMSVEGLTLMLTWAPRKV